MVGLLVQPSGLSAPVFFEKLSGFVVVEIVGAVFEDGQEYACLLDSVDGLSADAILFYNLVGTDELALGKLGFYIREEDRVAIYDVL